MHSNKKVSCVWSDLRRYWRASKRQKLLLGEALASLAIARIAMVCIPFRWIAAWLGTPGAQSSTTLTDEESCVARQIGWAVSTLGPRVPWDGRCLAQALAATFMLRRRAMNGTVSFGVSHDESGKLIAHAWLRCGSVLVTGGPGHDRFKTLTTFSRKRL